MHQSEQVRITMNGAMLFMLATIGLAKNAVTTRVATFTLTMSFPLLSFPSTALQPGTA